MASINKSCTYILPLFCTYFYKENKLLEEVLFTSFLNNCFCIKKENNKRNKEFTIQFNNIKDNKIFDNFLLNLEKTSIYISSLKGIHINITFSIPEELLESYNNYLVGSFSQILEEDKKTILSFSKRNISKEISLELHQIFSKSEKKRKELEEKLGMKIPKELELTSKPNVNQETFNI